ncbi:hypothetical protein GCM10029976_075450 [Kribbella albertanoniae]|uniref:DUF4429 domain-containing protein n=1 Tax=Kribbella albertanoniae TaxID=1266829 RepID=A0A4R4Q824_9ACTN|nr:DUF4429 domain-containing protein [Kribbella albertanoniae]TDC31354.1 DUF4429 domain-containing protein [Kribbella albertanoniae]
MEGLSGDELRGRNATMVWDGLGTIQLRYPGPWRQQKSGLTYAVLKQLGRRTIPVEALTGVEIVMPGGTETATIRLILREHADPLLAVAGGRFDELIDPYRLDFSPDQWLLADYYAQEIRTSIALHQLPPGPADRWLIEPPPAPDKVKFQFVKVELDGDELVLKYGFGATAAKKSYGNPWRLPLTELRDVEWVPGRIRSDGFLRLTTARTPAERPKAADDPETLTTWPLSEHDALFFGAKLRSLINW